MMSAKSRLDYATQIQDNRLFHGLSTNLGQCGRQNMLRPYLKIWEWEWIFGHAVKAISSPGVRSPCALKCHEFKVNI